MVSHILNVFVQEAQQPHSHNQGKKAFARFKQGNSAQTKMLCDQAFLGIHWDQGRKTILYASFRGEPQAVRCLGILHLRAESGTAAIHPKSVRTLALRKAKISSTSDWTFIL